MTIRRLFIAALLLGCSSAVSASFSRLVAIGDSLSDTGNLFSELEDALFGDPFGLLPTDNYANGRFSNGPIWLDYFAATHDELTVESYAIGGAYASTYAGNDNAIDQDLLSIPFVGQRLASRADGLAPQLPSVGSGLGDDDGVALWIGGNDLLDFASNGFQDPLQVVQPALDSIASAVEQLIGFGVSELLLFNLPDIGATPGARQSGQSSSLRQATLAFNTGLESLAIDHDSSPLNITMIDVFTRFEQILAEPEAYGFSDTTTGCIDGPFDSTPCSDPQAVRVFWDEIHPTTQAHRLIAELVDETLSRRELEPELVVPVSTLAL
ncbi:MAG: SGNH/GDSL hydrolase family protein, partial [Gammaproteobacteria bacterium]|nr:SGNH/GDSL hydrolase family protein [Gammaproteobacteria bacterium]